MTDSKMLNRVRRRVNHACRANYAKITDDRYTLLDGSYALFSVLPFFRRLKDSDIMKLSDKKLKEFNFLLMCAVVHSDD